MEKLNLTQQQHAFTNQKKCTYYNTKKLKPGLVASYDITSGLEMEKAYSYFGASSHMGQHDLLKSVTNLLVTAED